MERIGLEGSWRLRRLADGSSRPMAVPGDLMSALLEAGEIADPYEALNELDLQWIGREDWELERNFELPASFLERDRAFLDVEVLDTVAEVRLNGELLGTSENMFRRFRAEAKPFLRPGANRLSIILRSPERFAEEAASRLPYPIPASVYPQSSPHRNLLRKAQCMGGWDWGPCLMTGGVYDGISLVALDGPRIEYATTRMRREGPKWLLDVELDLDAASPASARIEAELWPPSGRAEALGGPEGAAPLAFAAAEVELPAGASRRSLSLLVEEPELWWPSGSGGQPLYELRVRAAPGGAGPAGPTSSAGPGGSGGHEIAKRVGFRELSLVAEEDEGGRSMKFVVNGREIFAKGANWIPADALPSRWTRGRLEGLLRSAAEANMNALRVWGGGRYESEDFYGLCDELGILVWQDCMFSCALYPSEASFLSNVEAEMRHQVLRLKDHPSLGLWCGNNEALGAITWYEESKKSPARYIVDYDRLTEGVLGRVVRELDPDRTFWPSSPSAGPNDFSDNWHSDGRGDMHFWSVWHEGKPFSDYLSVRPRFCSEFGFQSFPSHATVASFAPEGERNATSPAMEHHQRHPRGNALIVETMLRCFRMPRGFRETLYLSQVQQALAIKTAVEYWRSLRPRCMGTLYWQLNDVWPASSWSSLEYGGGWKLLHHEARRFYDPLIVALYLKDGLVSAVGVNDGTEAFRGRLSLGFRRFDGSLAGGAEARGDIPPGSAALLWEAPLASLAARPAEIYLEARLEGGLVGGSAELRGPSLERRNQLFLAEPKRCALVDPRLEASVVELPEGAGLAALLKASAPAFYVALEAEGLRGRFEDSGFCMAPGEARLVRFFPAPPESGAEAARKGMPSARTRGEAPSAAPSAAELASALRVMHLKASYD